MSEMKNDGGPAFPTPGTYTDDPVAGMTLRDYFAGQAMAAFLHDPDFSDDQWMRGYAQDAYRMADAMLAAAPTPPAVDGWRVLPFTGSWKTADERWEVYGPDGSGGAIYASNVRDGVVRGLLDALAQQAGADDHDTRN